LWNFQRFQLLKVIEADRQFALGSWEKSVSYACASFIEHAKNSYLGLMYEADKRQFNFDDAREIARAHELIKPYVTKVLAFPPGGCRLSPAFQGG